MKKNSSISHVRIPLFRNREVEVHACFSNANGVPSLEISNSSELPRQVAFCKDGNDSRPTVINVGAHCLRKLPWSRSGASSLRRMKVKVNALEDTLSVMR